jgi:hypothetical protein
MLACGEESGHVSVFDLRGNLLQRFAAHRAGVTTTHFVKDQSGTALVTSSFDGTLARYRVQAPAIGDAVDTGQLRILDAYLNRNGRVRLTIGFEFDKPTTVYSWRGYIDPSLGYALSARVTTPAGQRLKARHYPRFLPKYPYPGDSVTIETYVYSHPLEFEVVTEDDEPYVGCLDVHLTYDTRHGQNYRRAGLDAVFVQSEPYTVCSVDPDRLEQFRSSLLPTDLIVVGTLSEVESKKVEFFSPHGGKSEGESGSARLHVEEVLWGDASVKDDGITMKWTYTSSLPADYRFDHTDGQRGIYFLVCPEHLKTRTSGHRCKLSEPASAALAEHLYFPMEEQGFVQKLLSEYPLRIYSDPGFRSGRRIPVTLTLTNTGKAATYLPALTVKDGVFRTSSGVQLVVRSENVAGPGLGPRPGAIESSEDLAPVEVGSGEELSVTVDLGQLFPMTDPGFYYVTLQIDGLPPQLEYAVIVVDRADSDKSQADR